MILGAKLFLIVLFSRALWHKLSQFSIFKLELSAYEIIPLALTLPATFLIIFLEILCIVGLLFFAQTLWLCIALLSLYSLAMAFNLLQGKINIDCGCGGSFHKTISWLLVGRNFFVIILCLLNFFVYQSSAENIWENIFIAATFILLYEGAEQAIDNYQTHQQWLSKRGTV